MRLKKIIEAADAVAVIHAGDTVASAGYAGSGTPDQLFVSIEQRFLSREHHAISRWCSPPARAT